MDHMTSNIKQQLTQFLDLKAQSGSAGKLEAVLCREALLEIERLERLAAPRQPFAERVFPWIIGWLMFQSLLLLVQSLLDLLNRKG
jgi:hypothetical protein